ncbi:bolA-like protein [Capsaspora owczarzaki ATCC 30864]|uniref:BolA-like protein n=1 Tax=Capsaspora owczarzaki (strain ATCC 30864) TaxID=595528 RepID=A0A0D2VL89_CAPO3|nr:bolA-like protein [Capsaspora owczarzaki ATCC 30864]KJE90872.1 bolA-like protein [Capsaspora owczarzaki ATCC 30864]|eukprot:XP_004348860.1 bolA-like protein [Capsaspora owczarzaki ATCC 30864]
MLSRLSTSIARAVASAGQVRTCITAGAAAAAAGAAPLHSSAASLHGHTHGGQPCDGDHGGMTEGEERISNILLDKLKPTALGVNDISGGCGSMYQIGVESPMFAGLSLVQQHRLVNEILKDEIKGMHGMRLQTRTTPPKPAADDKSKSA